MGSITKLKHEVFRWLLQEEDYFLVVVNPGVEGVKLPGDLLAAGQPLGINLGLRMAVPIPDLSLDEAGISGTLSFNRTPHHCTFPWASVMQVSAGLEHLIWVEPSPEEAPAEASPPAPGETGRKRPRLKLV